MCIFCDIIAGKIPGSVVYEDEDVLAILDISQKTLGHTLVMPKKHVTNILEADPETLTKVILDVQKVAQMVVKNTGAKGVNIICNTNETAGQSVPHLHFHIVPRYDSDEMHIVFKDYEKPELDKVLQKVRGA
jgi:histidine triad (HIT) family protein